MIKHKTPLLIVIAASFAIFDTGIYFLITNRYINTNSDGLKSKMIDVDTYLPFKEGTKAIKKETDFKLTDNLPVIDGATALLPIYSSFINSVYPENAVNYSNGTFNLDSAMQYSNTVGAYNRLVDKTCDIALLASPNQAQIDKAKAAGVELEFTPIGKEAFVFITNAKNPVKNLSSQQVKDIFTGKITNWNKVGGPNKIIAPISRGKGSGSETTMEKWMNGDKVKTNPLGIFGGSIGFSFRFYVDEIVNNGKLNMISLDGVTPTRENIQNGTYPIITDFYAVTRKGEKNENVQKMVDWMLSDDGQDIINQVGYVSVK